MLEEETEILKYEVDLNSVEVLKLIAEAKNGDSYAQTAVFDMFKGYMTSIAKPYYQYGDSDDLNQAAMLGLWEAILDFNPLKGKKFTTFAHWKIRGEIIKSINENDALSISAGFKQFALKVKRTESKLLQDTGIKPTPVDIQNELDEDATIENIKLALLTLQGTLSMDQTYGSDDGEDEKSLGDFIEDNSTQDTIDDNGDVEMFIRYIENSGLTDKEQVVILNKYGLNEERRVLKDKEIAELLDNISVSRVQQMLYKARVKVIKAGKKDGVEFNLLKGREKTSK